MTGSNQDRNDTVTMTPADIKEMMTSAAREGARQALAEVGLGDEYAGTDVRNLRSLMKTFRLAKKTAFTAFIQQVTNFLFIIILLGVAAKFGLKFAG